MESSIGTANFCACLNNLLFEICEKDAISSVINVTRESQAIEVLKDEVRVQ